MAVSYVWPGTLPQQPLVDGYIPDGGVLQQRTPMDRGPAKTVYVGARVRRIEVAWLMSKDQLQALRVFDEETTRGVRFGWPDPLLGQVEVRFLRDQEGKSYTATPLGYGNFRVTATLEVLP